MKSIKDKVLEEYKKGNIVVSSFDGIQAMPLKEFLKQPAEGMLYDLNRCEAVVLTFINDPKWINDYAVAKVITELKSQNEALQKAIYQMVNRLEADSNAFSQNPTINPEFVKGFNFALSLIKGDDYEGAELIQETLKTDNNG